MESYKIQQSEYGFLREGDSRIGMQEIYSLQQRIDEYRAKFKHNDLTPFTWHFSGNKMQGWSGGTVNNKMILTTTTDPLVSPNQLNIDTNVYKYFSIKCLTNKQTNTQCKLEWYDSNSVLMGDTEFTIMSAGEYLLNIDLEWITGWSGSVDQIKLYCPDIYIYYIKVDKVDPMYIEKSIDVDSFNQMVEKVERMAGTPGGTIKDLTTIKAKDNGRINKSQVVKLYEEYSKAQVTPYNGCSTCDVFTRECLGKYGWVACQTCDGCNQYSPCSICDNVCHQESRPCTCYGVTQCYQQSTAICRNGYLPASCSCNAPYTPASCNCEGCNSQGSGALCSCYGYSSCSCDGVAYGKGCTMCNWACYGEQNCTCDAPNGTTCSSCHVTTNSNWKSKTGTSTCVVGCYGYGPCTSNAPSSSSSTSKTCTGCYSSCNQETSGCSSCYGYSSCSCNTPACYGYSTCTCESCNGNSPCVCNTTCNTQNPCTCDGLTCYGYTACTCDGVAAGYIPPQQCKCNSTCYMYSPCRVCNSCNGYSDCKQCDTSCYGDICRDCHNTNYH